MEFDTFTPVEEIAGVFDAAAAEEGKLYLRLIEPAESIIYENADDDEEKRAIVHYCAGVICVVDHTGAPIDRGNIATLYRNRGYNMAIDLTPCVGVAEHLNVRRGENGSMYVDMTIVNRPRGGLAGLLR